MDDADQAQVLEENYLQSALAARDWVRRPLSPGVECLSCGEVIPPGRRTALPGCCLCRACQESAERSMRR